MLDPLSDDYRRAFETFLAHTDQKGVAHRYLSGVVDRLRWRRVFVDVGAGEGGTTAEFAGRFGRTFAVEPSAHLHPALRAAVPEAEVISATVDRAALSEPADFVLCAHVLYYVPRSAWGSVVDVMRGWLADGGELVVVLQNPASDCMRLVRHFTGVAYDLADLRAGGLDTVRAVVHTESEADAVLIAQFVLNTVPLSTVDHPPTGDDLVTYVRREFADPLGGFTFTCTQDFLRITG
ncbi:class I SAM-dependent methyltransferase [Actinokineospora inagensis]|uniref:class I SAM-dependent methyltransferase n=1 Tax=Actinokineospora inagensis TaxID=103730 RepID=UPI00146F9476|nr:class I SAM-dependent methyltransferase [Actinokineospora inagensis]